MKNMFYEYFKYGKPLQITNVCTECCMNLNDANKLLSLNLNVIPLELLCDYNDGAQALNYNYDEFKYFLPRILELIFNYEFTSKIDISLSLKNLNLDRKEIWQEDEIKIIYDFALNFFINFLNRFDVKKDSNIVDVLLLFYTAKLDLEVLFNVWLSNLNINSILHLSDILMNHLNTRQTKVLQGFADQTFSNILLNWISVNKFLFTNKIEEIIINENYTSEHSYLLSFTYDILLKFEFVE